MRDIKFRACLKDEKEVVNVESIDFINEEIYFSVQNLLVSHNIEVSENFENIELIQYTGLKDSNNNEIYEGDILWNDYDEVYGKVIYDDGEWRFETRTFTQNLYEISCYSEIRGNIYENPELLEEMEN